MTTSTLFTLIIVLFVGEFILTKFLGYLNTRNWKTTLPKELSEIYDAKKYKKSMEYERVKYQFGILTSSISFAVTLALLVFGGFGFLDTFLRTFIGNEILIALAFFGILSVAQTLVGLPFSYYSTFVVEQKFGFNKMTPSLFFLDTIKGILLSFIIGGALIALIIWIYMISGSYFWMIGWGIMTFLSVFMMMFYSSLIVPIFNKQTPLKEGKLREKIEAFSNKVGFKLNNIYVIDGSKRSSKANAYFSGFGPKKRIVLYDTLIKDLTIEELVAVLAHEIGHYKRKHTLQMLIFSTLQTGAMFYILSLALAIPEVSFALGADVSSFHIGILAFGLLFTPISILLGIFSSVLSRKNEYEADAYAKEYFKAEKLVSALIKLSRNNLSNLEPHPCYEFVNYSHPTVLKRIAALRSK
ncbi:M48 family metallopeptidase [Candidatus Gracilibacteria bacterium]|nr:M48 family metallopeptidase [Candidatus Gracilibacteria bacterium]